MQGSPGNVHLSAPEPRYVHTGHVRGPGGGVQGSPGNVHLLPRSQGIYTRVMSRGAGAGVQGSPGNVHLLPRSQGIYTRVMSRGAGAGVQGSPGNVHLLPRSQGIYTWVMSRGAGGGVQGSPRECASSAPEPRYVHMGHVPRRRRRGAGSPRNVHLLPRSQGMYTRVMSRGPGGRGAGLSGECASSALEPRYVHTGSKALLYPPIKVWKITTPRCFEEKWVLSYHLVEVNVMYIPRDPPLVLHIANLLMVIIVFNIDTFNCDQIESMAILRPS